MQFVAIFAACLSLVAAALILLAHFLGGEIGYLLVFACMVALALGLAPGTR